MNKELIPASVWLADWTEAYKSEMNLEQKKFMDQVLMLLHELGGLDPNFTGVPGTFPYARKNTSIPYHLRRHNAKCNNVTTPFTAKFAEMFDSLENKKKEREKLN